MASSDDRRAAVVLLLLALVGLAVRFVTDRTSAPGAVAYRASSGVRPSRDSLEVRAARLARPLAAGETVDLDRAPAEELVRLPRIGPAMAGRIVVEREARGPFGSLDGLGRVPGLGAATREAVRPYATFSGRPAPAPSPPFRDVADLSRVRGIGPVLLERLKGRILVP
jgi:DNA uptake protein ComE-like DNA-binding protein